MLVSDAVADVRSRLNNLQVTANYDEPQARNDLNWSAHGLAVVLLPFRNEWYVNSAGSLTDGDQVPYEFLGPRAITVIVTSGGAEAKYVDPEEFYFAATLALDPPTSTYPIYTIAGDTANNRVFMTLPAALACTVRYWQPPLEFDRFGTNDTDRPP